MITTDLAALLLQSDYDRNSLVGLNIQITGPEHSIISLGANAVTHPHKTFYREIAPLNDQFDLTYFRNACTTLNCISKFSQWGPKYDPTTEQFDAAFALGVISDHYEPLSALTAFHKWLKEINEKEIVFIVEDVSKTAPFIKRYFDTFSLNGVTQSFISLDALYAKVPRVSRIEHKHDLNESKHITALSYAKQYVKEFNYLVK